MQPAEYGQYGHVHGIQLDPFPGGLRSAISIWSQISQGQEGIVNEHHEHPCKRGVAEVTIPKDVLIQNMRVDAHTLDHLCRVANLGSLLSGSAGNGVHCANALAALFIATGQDVANIAESSASLIYTEITPEGDLYLSLTLPSLIVATYGGGTGLPTQKECLETLGCYGQGKVMKLQRSLPPVALAGELSLSGANASLDWVRAMIVSEKTLEPPLVTQKGIVIDEYCSSG
jgi:hydroxymethylglutaryl-CoA reductase